MPVIKRLVGRSRFLAAAILLALGGTAALAAPAYAAEGSIDHVERDGDVIQILYSLPGAGDVEPDLGSLAVSLDGKPLTTDAELATDSETALRRTTILAIDVSHSMLTDNRFGEAQLAAKAFLDAAPDDLYVGIVTFSDTVTVAQEPSLDRAESASVIDGLTVSRQTRLYDGLLEAIDASGDEGSRSLLVLSDGRDTSDTEVKTVTGRIGVSDVKVDVVALGLSAEDTAVLQQLADAGNGTVISADDPAALTQVFADEAETIARQILISATPPQRMRPRGPWRSPSTPAARPTPTRPSSTSQPPRGAPPEDHTHEARSRAGERLRRSRKNLMLGGIVAAGLGLPGPDAGGARRLRSRQGPDRSRTASRPTPARARGSSQRRASRRPARRHGSGRRHRREGPRGHARASHRPRRQARGRRDVHQARRVAARARRHRLPRRPHRSADQLRQHRPAPWSGCSSACSCPGPTCPSSAADGSRRSSRASPTRSS